MLKLTNQQAKDRRSRVISLLKSPGWSDILDLYKDKLASKEKLLRTCTDYQLDKVQGFIQGLEYIFKETDSIIKGEKDNGISEQG